jgi:hypothetical protein
MTTADLADRIGTTPSVLRCLQKSMLSTVVAMLDAFGLQVNIRRYDAAAN